MNNTIGSEDDGGSDWRIERELDSARKSFEGTGNPHYVWKAIRCCIENELLVFPPWLTIYLAQCSERMLSEKAMQTPDVRKVLPWVFGFPQKPGPGKLLNPYLGIERFRFAAEFARRVLDGENLATARRDACNAAFTGKRAEVDDKTLKRWLLESFDFIETLDFTGTPESQRQWEEASYKFLAAVLGERVLSGKASTAEYERIMKIIEQTSELFDRT
jgi:hypothetical protein